MKEPIYFQHTGCPITGFIFYVDKTPENLKNTTKKRKKKCQDNKKKEEA